MGPLSEVEYALIVEDDYLLAVDLKDQLERLGCHHARIASGPAEAEQSLELERPDLVSLDIRLGNAECDDLANRLKRLGIPFIYVSGFVPRDKPHLPEAPWINKPVDEVELIAALQELALWEGRLTSRNC